MSNIDTEKMKALAAELRANHEAMKSWMPTHQLESSPASKGADAIDLLLAELEAAAADKRDYLDTLVQVLNVIGYSEEFAAAHHDLKVSEGVKLFLAQRQGEGS
ncbi:hypothetical protein LGM79_10055 [Burkholderia multivorans]|nr:hypothetical protein [Burkholderia multivorans]MDN7985679.1 hypothetical protein [Burkholderia multivorans]